MLRLHPVVRNADAECKLHAETGGFCLLQAEAAPRAMGHHLDWPRRLGMALDAAKVLGPQLQDVWDFVSAKHHCRSINDIGCQLSTHGAFDMRTKVCLTLDTGAAAAALASPGHPTSGPEVAKPPGRQALACEGNPDPEMGSAASPAVYCQMSWLHAWCSIMGGSYWNNSK
jgi:hypothetical protein